MRYRILLTGNNKVIMDDFFIHLENEFELQTTSLRHNDITSHIRYYEPNAVVLCMRNESADDIGVFSAVNGILMKSNIPIIIIGSEEECREFEACVGGISSLIIKRPVSLFIIRDTIFKFVENWQRKLEEEKEMELAREREIAAEMEKAAAEAAEKKKAKLSEANTDKPLRPGEKKSILVVDDDPMMLKLIKEQLKDTYSVATAINGGIALKFLESKRADLILLDYEMPGENGAV